MKAQIFHEEVQISLEKASELGKTLSSGGITLADNQPAFGKKCGK